ncbi:MAG: SAM-dependent methyltransferase [Anaerolineae bacterium]|nr:SAM-dependent methyltransferase [Anaerolineae bacterium]
MTPSKDSIVDATVPSAGRIYDYLLGGHHNFEVDRQAAEGILAASPFMSKVMRLQRWCLQDVAHELGVVRGFDTIIDFASGLPTQDHLHLVVPEGTTVIYSDYDPVVVEYGKQILQDTPNVYFFEADARRPLELLESDNVRKIIGTRRNVGLVFWGISIFLTDEELIGAAQQLYHWAGDESCWAFNAQAIGADTDHPMTQRLISLYARIGSTLYMRSEERFRELLYPWVPDDRGFISFLDWHGMDESIMTVEDLEASGPAGSGAGAYLFKQSA